MRYVVTELEGYLEESGPAGLSVQVIDTANCHRVVRAWRTEEHADYDGDARARVRQLAADYCAVLNNTTARRCQRGHPLSIETTYYRPNGIQGCRVCRAEYRKRPPVTWVHGTLHAYAHGCRCQACCYRRSEANRISYLNRKARLLGES